MPAPLATSARAMAASAEATINPSHGFFSEYQGRLAEDFEILPRPTFTAGPMQLIRVVINRAEVYAVIQALRMTLCLTIYTDSAYVVDVVKTIHNRQLFGNYHKIHNGDLLIQLDRLLGARPVHAVVVQKVKAHQALEDALPGRHFEIVYGNAEADEGAKMANKRSSFLTHIRDKAYSHVHVQEKRLYDLWTSIVAISTQRLSPSSLQTAAEAVESLETFPRPQLSIPQMAINAFSFGGLFLHRLVAWATLLKFEGEQVSWVELMTSFRICTGTSPPINLTPSVRGSKQAHNYSLNMENGASEEDRQSLHMESLTFANACKSAATWAALEDWPLVSTSTTTLKYLGYGRPCQGPAIPVLYPRRAMVRNALAVHFAKSNKASRSRPLKLGACQPVWDQQWTVVDTLSASQKQRARSACEGNGRSAGPGRTSIPSRLATTRVYAKEEEDSDDDVTLASLAFTDRISR